MDISSKNSSSLFEVYLRLKPNAVNSTDRFLEVDEAAEGYGSPTYITIKPPTNDHRKRAVEKFAFTRVFEEAASQSDIFNGASVVPLVEGVLGANDRPGRDGLLATLGVTGSGKSHTILGTKSQRGLTQMTLDVLFKSIGDNLLHPLHTVPELAMTDVSEAQLLPAGVYLDSIYGDGFFSRETSRAATPMDYGNYCIFPQSPMPRRHIPRPSVFPPNPRVDDVQVEADANAEYAIVISMYEVYNDRIFDLLNGPSAAKIPAKDLRRRPLLFKSTEYSPDRKVVAGLKKIACGSLEEALMVLETGLIERRVAGTGSNATSSRSHGFFCIEVKKRKRGGPRSWKSSTLTIVDLAGSERARAAKTTGSTLAEAGKINESLMYLGQCMQMQSDNATHASHLSSHPAAIVPFRQCKLTELLFSNSFSTPTNATSSRGQHQPPQRIPQKAVMIVTADPRGDFNATSQILRYSALAREITVPRIPSVTSTILSSTPTAIDSHGSAGPGTATSTSSRNVSPNWTTTSFTDDSELSSALEVLQLQLDTETTRRRTAEANWARAEQRLDDLEATVREECWAHFEAQMDAERARWREAWNVEAERGVGFVDRKVELVVRAGGSGGRGLVQVHEDEDADEDDGEGEGQDPDADAAADPSVDALLRQVEELRWRNAQLERERGVMRTPSRKVKVLKARAWNLGDEGDGLENASP